MTLRHEDDTRITREAAEWFMELQTEGAACHRDFAQWLRRSPEHVAEFLAITGVSRRLDGVDPQHRIDIDQLLSGDGAQIVQLLPPGQSQSPASHDTHTRRSASYWKLGLAAACAAIGVLVMLRWSGPGTEVYETKVGEQRAFKLPDGSLIHLNTQSRAQVHFSATAREIRLLDGEALFVVERDAQRPFQVLSGATTVVALGTQFNIYRLPGGNTTVSVVEGAVRVTSAHARTNEAEPAAAPAGTNVSMRLDAGEQADIADGRLQKHMLSDVDSVTAWRQRRLVFRDKPLAEVVAEFNRYNAVQIEVGEDAGREPLSGVFAADRPESLALFLEKDKSVQIERRGDRLIIHSR